MSVAYWEILKTTQNQEKETLWTRNNPSRVPNSTPGAKVKVIKESQVSVKNTSATSEAVFSYLRTEHSNIGQELEARNKGCTISMRNQRIKQLNSDISSV